MSGLRIRRWSWPVLGLLAGVVPGAASGQGLLVESVEVRCPSVLGIGVETDLVFCDVLAQQDPALGVIVVLPPRRGEATLSFNLHNRHTYSEDDVTRGRAYARYLSEVAVASAAGDVLARRSVSAGRMARQRPRSASIFRRCELHAPPLTPPSARAGA